MEHSYRADAHQAAEQIFRREPLALRYRDEEKRYEYQRLNERVEGKAHADQRVFRKQPRDVRQAGEENYQEHFFEHRVVAGALVREVQPF